MQLLFRIFLPVFSVLSISSASLGQPQARPSELPIPNGPTYVDIEAAPEPPALTLNISDLKYGSQGTGVESCMYVTITNSSNTAQTMTSLYTEDTKHYTIPSPSKQMIPMSIQPKSNVTISVCFKTDKTGEFKSRLVIRTPQDSFIVPLAGKGIKPEDVGKIPKADMNFKWKKKGRDGNIKLQLITSSKVTLQLFDDLGNMKIGFLNGDFKNEGVYEIPFDGLDKAKMKLAPGNYYLRCLIEDITRGPAPVKITRTIEMPD